MVQQIIIFSFMLVSVWSIAYLCHFTNNTCQ